MKVRIENEATAFSDNFDEFPQSIVNRPPPLPKPPTHTHPPPFSLSISYSLVGMGSPPKALSSSLQPPSPPPSRSSQTVVLGLGFIMILWPSPPPPSSLPSFLPSPTLSIGLFQPRGESGGTRGPACELQRRAPFLLSLKTFVDSPGNFHTCGEGGVTIGVGG